MTTFRNLGLLAIALGSVLVVLAPRRRARAARTPAHTRPFMSRRIVDRDELESRALDTWDRDGGAQRGGIDADLR